MDSHKINTAEVFGSQINAGDRSDCVIGILPRLRKVSRGTITISVFRDFACTMVSNTRPILSERVPRRARYEASLAQSACPLLRLPVEIQLSVLRLLLKNDTSLSHIDDVEPDTHSQWWPLQDKNHQIQGQVLLACRHFYHLGLPVLYGENRLTIHIWPLCNSDMIGLPVLRLNVPPPPGVVKYTRTFKLVFYGSMSNTADARIRARGVVNMFKSWGIHDDLESLIIELYPTKVKGPPDPARLPEIDSLHILQQLETEHVEVVLPTVSVAAVFEHIAHGRTQSLWLLYHALVGTFGREAKYNKVQHCDHWHTLRTSMETSNGGAFKVAAQRLSLAISRPQEIEQNAL